MSEIPPFLPYLAAFVVAFIITSLIVWYIKWNEKQKIIEKENDASFAFEPEKIMTRLNEHVLALQSKDPAEAETDIETLENILDQARLLVPHYKDPLTEFLEKIQANHGKPDMFMVLIDLHKWLNANKTV